MKFKQLHKTLLLPLCAALTACSDEVLDSINPDAGKTAIELAVGGVDRTDGVTTRAYTGSAVITKEETGMIAFPENTNIFMVMQSEYDTNNPDFNDPDYTDQSPSHKQKTTVARGTVTAGQTSVSFDDVNKRYWDDAHARSTQLTIWAYAQMSKPNWTECMFQKRTGTGTDWSQFENAKFFTGTTTYNWRQDDLYPGIKSWNVTHNTNGYHDETSILCQDLLFSNNIANNTNYDKRDNRLKFNTSTKKFPTDNKMYFRHAMSKITIHIKKGVGFGDQFNFTAGTGNVKLKDFNRIGTFNIKEGEFQDISDHNEIPQIYQHTTPNTGDAFTLEALAIPNINKFRQSKQADYHDDYSRFTSNGTNVMMEFTIEGNKYEITSKQLYNALHVGGDPSGDLVTNAVEYTDNGTYIPLEAGKNYDFTLTIGKTKINNISAQVVPWETVTATNYNPDNARIQIDIEDDRGAIVTDGLSIYRANDDADAISDTWENYNWWTGYTGTNNKASLTYNSETDKFTLTPERSTAWYWDSNKTYYHFRSVQPASHEVKAGTSTAQNDDDKYDYIELAASASGVTTYTDVKWGAPFKDLKEENQGGKDLFEYKPESGYDVNKGDGNPHQIYKAIGPTPNPIVIIPFHMMSDVTIKLTTTTGTDAIKLDEATISLVNAYTTGKVLMGNGKVVETGSRTTTTNPATISCSNSSTHEYHYGAIPQDLKASGYEAYLIIQTADDNRYIVNLKDLYTDSAPSPGNIKNPYSKASDDHYYITRWYPGFKYTYTLHLTKKGISDFKATIVNWENINVNYGDITIK